MRLDKFQRIVSSVLILSAILFGASSAYVAPTYLVTNGKDSGIGSLRYGLFSGATEINIIGTVSKISIDSTLYYTNDSALKIIGSGQTVDGNGNGNTLLEITNGADLSITKLNFTDGGGYSVAPGEQGGGKGVFVNVPLDRIGIVELFLKQVAVTGVGLHGIHVLDCDLEGCGAGGGGGGEGSAASIHATLQQVTVDDAGNGGFDADGVRIDDRGDGDIIFNVVDSSFTNIGADGVELDEGDDGNVIINVRKSNFDDNGGYCEGVDVNNPDDAACVEDDDGELVLDLDDGFDIDEAGEGSLSGQIKNISLVGNLDEGLDFDEEGEGDISITLVKVEVINNGDEGIKVSEVDGGNLTAQLRKVTADSNNDDGIQIEQSYAGDINVTVNATETLNNAKFGLKVSQDGEGGGSLKVRGSNISEGIDSAVPLI